MSVSTPQLDSSGTTSLSATVCTAVELSPFQRSKWIEIQEANPDLQNPYFRVEFVEAISRYRSNVRIAVFEYEGNPIAFWPFQEILPGICRPVGEKIGCLHGMISPSDFPYSPDFLGKLAGIKTWHFDHLPVSQSGFTPYHAETVEAPFMDLSDGYETYLASRKKNGHSNKNISNSHRKYRKFEREVGAVSFEANTKDTSILECLRDWKREQMRATGIRDFYLQSPWVTPLTEELLSLESNDFRGMMAALTLDGAPIAALYGLRSHQVFHGLFLAFDSQFAKYSPGMILLLELAQNAQEMGLHHIDMGKGPAPYKRTLMSGSNQLAVGAFDQRPICANLHRTVYQSKTALARSPIGQPLRKTAGRILRGIDCVLGGGQ